jgi:hypothetical protein
MRLQELVSACDFVTDVHAPGDGTVHCALTFLSDGSAVFTGVRRGDGYDEVEMRAVAPGGPLELSPEKGVSGAVSAIGEAELDDKLIDDAWVIRGEPALLVALRDELRPLSPFAPHIRLADGWLTVTFGKVAAEHARDAVHGALALWHRIAFHGL